MAMKQRNPGICIVGTGWGLYLGAMIRRAHPNSPLFVCGRNAAKTATAARSLDAAGTFSRLEEALADGRVHGMVLALPHSWHRQATEASLRAGKHVFVEKPIATSLDDADEMIAAARRYGRTLMVSDNLHCHPGIAEAHRRVQSGELGRPLYFLANSFGLHHPAGWRTNALHMGGGVVIDAGVRPVRALRLIFGEPDSVFAARGPQVQASMEGEDSAQLLFFGHAGWQAHVLLSWSARRGDLPEYLVICEKWSLHLFMNRASMVFYPTEPLPFQRLVSKGRPYWLQEKLMSQRMEGKRVRLPGNDTTGHMGQMREFLRAVASGSAETASAVEARRDLEIIFRAYESMNSGRLLPLETRQPVAV